MSTMFFIQFAIVLLCILIGAQVGGIGLGVLGGIGLAVLSFGFHLQPTSPPIDVMLMIMAVVSAAAANVPLRPSEISFKPSASICNTSLAHSMYCSASFVCMVSALFKYGVSRRMRSLFISSI